MDRRKTAKHSRDPLPIGTIKIRRRQHRCGEAMRRYRMVRVRFIKVGYDRHVTGWMPLARWTWELKRGPVPPGMRVFHLDGNTLHDELSNYGLRSATDVLWFYRSRGDIAARNARNVGRVLVARNRDAKVVNHCLRRFRLRDLYAVDTDRRIIHVVHERTQSRLLSLFGVTIRVAANGRIVHREGPPNIIAVRGCKLRNQFVDFEVVFPKLMEAAG